MKFLRLFLAFLYVALIILLLLRNCGGCERRADEPRPDDPLPAVKEKFKADVVMCIDVTGSMGAIINTIKNNALSFYPDLRDRCRREGKEITAMRIRVIAFRDYQSGVRFLEPNEHVLPFQASDFFSMPADEGKFRSYVSRLAPAGGGDAPEAGYDALAWAMKSDWDRSADVHQIIILWTDNASHPAGRNPYVVRDYTELTELWSGLNPRGKRLILFAPNDASWEQLVRDCDHAVRHDVTTAGGLSDLDYEEILRTLSETM